MKGIADTGFIVALAFRNDAHHAWAADISSRVTEPLLTCESVISEAAFHIKSSAYVLSLIDDGLLCVDFNLEENLQRVCELAQTYEDRHPDLADLCLIRMSELYPKHVLITVDEADFRVYRRNKREAIPLICPPRKQ